LPQNSLYTQSCEPRPRCCETPRLQGELDFLKVQYLGQDEILAETRDLYDRWPTLAAEEKRAIIEAIVQKIQVGKEVVEIDLSPFPGSIEVAAERQHNITVALPFTSLRLAGRRPRVFPRGYPHSPRTMGERIRQRRMDLGLTQRTLAEKLGCWYQSVASWERDESVPLSGRWPAIEGVLGAGLVPERDGLPGQIRIARLRLGLTQEDLARRAGVNVRTVRNAEAGKHAPSGRSTQRLRAILGDCSLASPGPASRPKREVQTTD
jgi:transcriptional regulator with XRE-family HTH domain